MTVGETYIPQATFSDAADVRYDPDSVSLRLLDPAGVESFPASVHVSTGVYQFPFIGTDNGIWRGWVYGNGPDGNVVIEPFSVCFEEEQ